MFFLRQGVTRYSEHMGDTLPPQVRRGMPWKECHVMDERVRFPDHVLDDEKMATLCASSGSPERPATRSTTALTRSTTCLRDRQRFFTDQQHGGARR